MIKILKDDYSIRPPRATLGMDRRNPCHEPRPDEDRPVNEAWRERAGAWPTSGYRRLAVMLRGAGLTVNANRARRWMHELGLRGEAPRRAPRTTDGGHACPRFPNLVEGLEATRPDRAWVADITHVRLGKEFVYQSVLMDVFTRRVRGWPLGRSLEQEWTLTAWARAFARGRPALHHSDQGARPAATAAVDMRKAREVKIGMASVGAPKENG